MAPVIYTIGETVLDIIFREGKPVGAIPGGSMLNSSISLARSGLEVQFISEYGNDQPGAIIHEFLAGNNVGTRFINRYDDGKTALALAFLDKDRNASYSFHTSYPRVRMKEPLPETKKGDLILFGSIYSITQGLDGKMLKWINKAKSAGTIIVYDPNFRKSHVHLLETVLPWICRNIEAADIVRGSDEDFHTIFGLDNPDDVHAKLASLGCRNLIITRNSKSVVSWFGDHKVTVNIPPVKPLVSTIGAGDNFNAGIIYALVNNGMIPDMNGIASNDISKFKNILGTAVAFAAEVCKSVDNYISPGFVKTMKQ